MDGKWAAKGSNLRKARRGDGEKKDGEWEVWRHISSLGGPYKSAATMQLTAALVVH